MLGRLGRQIRQGRHGRQCRQGSQGRRRREGVGLILFGFVIADVVVVVSVLSVVRNCFSLCHAIGVPLTNYERL